MEQQVNGQLIEPLQIFPRACKPPGERNIHGLKVNTRAGPSQHGSPAVSDSLPSNSLKKSSAELKKILANGQMNEQDIRYRDTLGHGNGGTVYKAYHVPSGKILAVKVILLDITLELQKQIMSELEILYKCDSSYIIGFYGAFFVENRISICTEFMDGGSLDVYRKIPEHVLGRIAIAVVKGLTYLWSLKILHRDVKPSNMLVNTRGQVKLCDFGVSTQLVNSIAKTYVGTNAYMAPERISGEQYGIHSDVWSLGISFMEVCCLQIDASMYIHPNIRKNEDLKNNNNKPPRCYVCVYTELNSKILLLSLSGLCTDSSEVLFLTHHLYKTFLESFLKIQVPRLPLRLIKSRSLRICIIDMLCTLSPESLHYNKRLQRSSV
ncbi:dual specificity mitogen-activated protein kinase kinase 5 isoform X6 [Ursus arctos]|nr:dual specificity mitogen-activated protein kinase kinase 5 isoform X6 [Ursus arctos]